MPDKWGNRSDMGLWHLEKSPNNEKRGDESRYKDPFYPKYIPVFCVQIYGEQKQRPLSSSWKNQREYYENQI